MRPGCAGPIPVELLRWKFVEGRTVELKYNAGLELPDDIGKLGDSVTQIDGELSSLQTLVLIRNHLSGMSVFILCRFR